ncbi:unnamed protein product [Withania somnifera]
MSGYPHNVPGYGYGAPPPSAQPYSSASYGATPPSSHSSAPYGAQPPSSQSYSSAPYGVPPPSSSSPYSTAPPPQSFSPYAPVPSPYGAGAPPYGDPHKPPKENKPQSSSPYGGAGYPGPPPSAPYGDPNRPSHPYGRYHAPPPSGPYGASNSSFATLVPSAFPPGTDPNVITCFQLADQDGSGLIDDKELQKALSSYNQSFSLRTVHLLMYHFTNTNIRKVGPKEFSSVFYGLQEWRGIFERFDRDRSGKIDLSELRDALLSLGYAVSPSILDLLVSKFDKTGGNNKAIEYDNFIECCLTVKGLTEKFKEKDTAYSGSATFTYESFMLAVLPFVIA